jgi:hypothetical protein
MLRPNSRIVIAASVAFGAAGAAAPRRWALDTNSGYLVQTRLEIAR